MVIVGKNTLEIYGFGVVHSYDGSMCRYEQDKRRNTIEVVWRFFCLKIPKMDSMMPF